MLRDREGTMLALVGILAEAGEPVGTRTAAGALKDQYDTTLSESTVSRLLQEMDQRGWTTPIATKGRALTAEGRARHQERLLATRASTTLSSAISVHTVAGLLELLKARKAVESAVAADAAGNCTPKTSPNCGSSPAAGGRARAGAHRRSLGPDLPPQGRRDEPERHAEGALRRRPRPAAGSRRVCDGHHPGEHHQELSVIDHHRAIVDAIEAGDAPAAEAAMDRHFAEMICEAEQFMVGRNADVVTRLLEFMESHPPFARQG